MGDELTQTPKRATLLFLQSPAKAGQAACLDEAHSRKHLLSVSKCSRGSILRDFGFDIPL